MRRWTTALAALAMTLTALPAGAADAPRALWAWNGPSDQLLTFSVGEGIDRLFLNAPPGFSSDPSYANFLADAHAHGIEVYALAGDPSWAERTRRSDPFVDWVREVVGHGGFDGLAPDVEPYLHRDWNHARKRAKLIDSYLAALARAGTEAGSLPLVPAVPFWFDHADYSVDGVPLVDEVAARVDGIAVMAYRDFAVGPNGILEHAAYEVALGEATDTEVMIGVETAPSSEYDHVTFHEEGRAAMEHELSLVSGEFSSRIWGFAVHHYGSFSEMAP